MATSKFDRWYFWIHIVTNSKFDGVSRVTYITSYTTHTTFHNLHNNSRVNNDIAECDDKLSLVLVFILNISITPSE